MLYVVDSKTNEILFRIDAWISDCIEQAKMFIRREQLSCIGEKITMNGDMVLMVER